MISCRQMEYLLPIHAVEETSLSESLQVEEHLKQCADCRESLDDYRRICRAAREGLADSPHVPRPEFPVVAAVRPPNRRVWPRLAAAIVILLAGVVLGRWSAATPPAAGTGEPRVIASSGRAPQAVPAVSGRLIEQRRPAISVFSPAVRETLSRAARAKGAR